MTEKGINRYPVASPDVRQIAFVSATGRTANIWRMDVDGSNAMQLTNEEFANMPSWSPDGAWVFYLAVRDGRPLIAKIPSGGGTAQIVHDDLFNRPAVSPDGKWLAGFIQRDQKLLPAVFPIEGGSPRILDFTLTLAGIRWTPDGRALATPRTVQGASNIWRYPLDRTAPAPLTGFSDADEIFDFDISREGRLLVARGRYASDVVLITGLPRAERPTSVPPTTY